MQLHCNLHGFKRNGGEQDRGGGELNFPKEAEKRVRIFVGL